MFADTPDEAFHICTKYAPDCLGAGHGSATVTSSMHSFSSQSTSGQNGSTSSTFHQTQDFSNSRDQVNKFVISSSGSSGNNFEGHREFVDITGEVDGLEIIGEDDEYYNNLELEGEDRKVEQHQFSTSTQRSNTEWHRVEINRTRPGIVDQTGRRPILPLPDPEYDSSASDNNRPDGVQPSVEHEQDPDVNINPSVFYTVFYNLPIIPGYFSVISSTPHWQLQYN